MNIDQAKASLAEMFGDDTARVITEAAGASGTMRCVARVVADGRLLSSEVRAFIAQTLVASADALDAAMKTFITRREN